MDDDTQLLRRYLDESSQAAFTALVERHFDLVHSAALRQANGNYEVARNAAQRVFTDLALKAAQLVGHPSVVGWLYTATRFAVHKLLRAERRRMERERRAIAMADSSPPLSDDAWAQLRRELDNALHDLAVRDREVIVLRYFAGRSWQEVGHSLGLSENAANMRASRALERLRTGLTRRGITSTASALAVILVDHAVAAAPSGLGVSIAGTALTEAAAAGGASAAIAAASLMTTKLTWGIAGVAALVAIGTGVYYDKQAQAANAVADVTMGQIADLHAQLGRRGRIATTGAPKVTPAKVSPPLAAGVSGLTRPQIIAAIADNGPLRQLEGKAYLADVRLKYGTLYRSLGLSADQIAGFEQIQLKAASDLVDLEAAAYKQDIDPSKDAGFQAAQAQIESQRNEAIGGLLGSTAQAQIADFDRAAGARQFVAELGGVLSSGDTPLTTGQADALVSILSSHSASGSPLEADSRSIDWATANALGATAEIKGVLSGTQLTALGSVRAVEDLSAIKREADQAADSPSP